MNGFLSLYKGGKKDEMKGRLLSRLLCVFCVFAGGVSIAGLRRGVGQRMDI